MYYFSPDLVSHLSSKSSMKVLDVIIGVGSFHVEAPLCAPFDISGNKVGD